MRGQCRGSAQGDRHANYAPGSCVAASVATAASKVHQRLSTSNCSTCFATSSCPGHTARG